MNQSCKRRKSDLDVHLFAGGLCEICNQPNPGPAPTGHQQAQCPACGRHLDLNGQSRGGAFVPEETARR